MLLESSRVLILSTQHYILVGWVCTDCKFGALCDALSLDVALAVIELLCPVVTSRPPFSPGQFSAAT